MTAEIKPFIVEDFEPESEKRTDVRYPPQHRTIRFTQFADIRLSTASRYLVKGLIPSVGFVVVWGEPKCGKSFLIFDMTAHVAAGWSYRGRLVKQCPVVFFALEGQEVSTAERFRASVAEQKQASGARMRRHAKGPDRAPLHVGGENCSAANGQ